MRIRVPATMPYEVGMSGLWGLGQDDNDPTGGFDDSSSPTITPLPDLPVGSGPSLSIPNLNPLPSAGTPVTSTQVTNSQTGLIQTLYQYPSGEIVDQNGNIIQGPSGSGASAGSGVNLAQLLGAASTAATTAAKINQSLQTPSLIPGTSLVYNPATGQISNATGVAQALTSSLGSMLPLLLLAGGAFLLISMMGKR
jgi:hypothetical protein